MELRKTVVALAIITTSVFAGVNTVDALVEEANKTTDVSKQKQLMIQIEKEIESMSVSDRVKASDLVKAKLKPMKQTQVTDKSKMKG